MSQTLEYIDMYFTGQLSASEKAEFESKCESDPVFAEEVAFYISARAGLKNNLINEKKKEFDELYRQLSTRKPAKSMVRRLAPYLAAAAACLILFFGWQLFFKDNLNGQKPAQLANEYIQKNIEKLSITMGGDKDSLNSAIAAFNKGDYKEAEKIFLDLSRRNNNPEVIKNLGFLYLKTGNYDKAISQFDALAGQTDLYVNPGLFYKAVTLMKRSSNGDVARAKLILNEVIEKNLPGSKEAKEWLNKM